MAARAQPNRVANSFFLGGVDFATPSTSCNSRWGADAHTFADKASAAHGELAAAVLLVAVYEQRGLVHDMLSQPALVMLGRLSYGVYLWHYPVRRAVPACRFAVALGSFAGDANLGGAGGGVVLYRRALGAALARWRSPEESGGSPQNSGRYGSALSRLVRCLRCWPSSTLVRRA